MGGRGGRTEDFLCDDSTDSGSGIGCSLVHNEGGCCEVGRVGDVGDGARAHNLGSEDGVVGDQGHCKLLGRRREVVHHTVGHLSCGDKSETHTHVRREARTGTIPVSPVVELMDTRLLPRAAVLMA